MLTRLQNIDDQLALSGFLSSRGASLEAGILGSLYTSAAGGFAESLSAGARGSLSAWISSPECSLSAGLKGSVSVWLGGGVGGSVGGGFGGKRLPSLETLECVWTSY